MWIYRLYSMFLHTMLFVLMPMAFEGLLICNYMMYTTEAIQRKLTTRSKRTCLDTESVYYTELHR